MIVGSPTKLNLIPSGVMPVVYINQGDAGYDKEFLIYNGDSPYNVPSGVSATIRGTKADGYGVTEAAALTTGSNLVTVTITEQMVAAAGANLYELVFVDTDGLRIATINMVWEVKKDALGDAVISESDLDYASQVMDQLQSASALKNQVDTNTDNIAENVSDLAAEIAARIAADNALQSGINAEAVARANQDAVLSARMDTFASLPSGSTSGNAELLDIRVGENGITYPNAGDAVRGQAKDINRQIDSLHEELYNHNLFNGYKVGYYSNSSGAYESWHSTYLCTIEPIPCSYGDDIIFKNSGAVGANTIYVTFFDSTMTFIKSKSLSGTATDCAVTNDATLENVAYCNLSLAFSSAKSPDGVPWLNVYRNSRLSSTEQINVSLKVWGEQILDWKNYIYNYNGGTITFTWNRIGISTPIVAKTNMIIKIKAGYEYAVTKFSSETVSLATQISTTGFITVDTTIAEGEIFLLTIRKPNNSSIFPDEAVNLTLINVGSLAYKNYVLGSDLMRKPLVVTKIGELTYYQGFCIYNGNYYSIDGDNISVQDSTFAETDNQALSAGHGNSLQLGESKYAYASGWDDNKIYKVDLDTLTVVDTINLPTTGYTTGVVDELNGIAYIFQRDTYPDTETRYNFIVYDYVNNRVISAKQTKPFGAMQACDFYNDKIFVVNGMGNASACPNGYKVYDTSGNIVAEYFLEWNIEPEGVCINRDTRELLISLSSKYLYKVSL